MHSFVNILSWRRRRLCTSQQTSKQDRLWCCNRRHKRGEKGEAVIQDSWWQVTETHLEQPWGKEEALLTLGPKSARIKVASEMLYSRVHIGCQEMVISGSFDYICQNSGKPSLNCSQTGWGWGEYDTPHYRNFLK